MAIDDVVSTDDAFVAIRKIMGRKAVAETSKPGVLKSVHLSPKDVDDLYLTVKKMWRGLQYLKETKLLGYFFGSVMNVENAYLAGNLAAFKIAMRNLAINIYAD